MPYILMKTNLQFFKLARKDKSIVNFAGTGTGGNLDGPASTCQFIQPKGLCTEFDHVVYVCDSQAGCIKLFSTMGECGKYFKAISNTYDAFSIHSKGERYSVKSLDDASKLVLSCKQYFEENEA